jgi:hypothetical protein
MLTIRGVGGLTKKIENFFNRGKTIHTPIENPDRVDWIHFLAKILGSKGRRSQNFCQEVSVWSGNFPVTLILDEESEKMVPRRYVDPRFQLRRLLLNLTLVLF